VNIEDAQAHFQQIIAGLNPGEPLTITKRACSDSYTCSAEAVAMQGWLRQRYIALDGA